MNKQIPTTQQNQTTEFARGMKRREFVKATAVIALCAGFPELTMAEAKRGKDSRLFPINLPGKQWMQFPAEGFSRSACGVIYRLPDTVTNGMPLGGVDTGCFDLETSGMIGYNTIFNTVIPRRGPDNVPLLGLSLQGKTWVLCDPKQIKKGWGEYQYTDINKKYRVWKDNAWVFTDMPIGTHPSELPLSEVALAKEIHYWGHYPVVDLEFETDAPISVGLRAWSPFLPGAVVDSMLPGTVFEVHLRNTTKEKQQGTIAVSFPGPTAQEADSDQFQRQQEQVGHFSGVTVSGKLASYALGVIGQEKARFGGGLGAEGSKWAAIAKTLPEAGSNHSDSSVAVDFILNPGEVKIVRFAVTWNAPTWNAGGYNWADAEHTFTHMYVKHYPSALAAAEKLAKNHEALLKRILAWQQVVYTDEKLPLWLRDSLINVLYMITEDGMWAQKKSPLPDWVKEEDGLFGLIECPRGCPQFECIPCSFYGNQPLVYFFPELALSTYRGYKGYQFPDGAPPWIFGGCTGNTPPIDFANTTRGYQFVTNGISLAAMLDRYYLCYGEKDKDFINEFYPVMKQCMIWTVNLRPEYPIGDRIIAMPTGNSGTEWFEAPEPGWAGMTAHVGGLHLAQLRIAERFADLAGDKAFAKQCRDWIKDGAESMENKLWTGGYYLNYFEPETGRKSDLVFGYQMDGEWITDHHGLPSGLPEERVKTTLETIKRCNVAVTKYGAVNYANKDGTPAQVKGYGTYSYFPPEALMLAMNYMYEEQREFGIELARKVWHNLVCLQGYTWDMPNIMRGDVDTGERTFGNDYYQDMMLWSLPAAMEGKDFGAPTKPGGLVDRVLKASRACVVGVVLAFVAATSASADVRMGGLFVDGAVLQREMRVPVWGFANDGEKVTVLFCNQKISATTVGGKWIVWLKPMKAGGPFTMTVTGKNSIELTNVMVGEVWLCSGQSNMDLPLSMTENGEEAAAQSADPLLRQFKVPMASTDAPQSEIDSKMILPPGIGVAGNWQESTPEKSIEFSAVGYYFGRDLRKRLNVPVGLLNSALGGTMAQEWTSHEALLANPTLRHLVEQPQPDSGGIFKGKPCGLYNAMIAPLTPYAIRGVIWYQGESDAGVAYQYRTLLPAMISDWRKAWGEGDFPFLVVQIAPFTKIHPAPHESGQAELRESQFLTSQTVPKTALVVITDCGDQDNVHPKRKEPVGARLALAARALAYHEKIVCSGPIYKSLKVQGNLAILSFSSIGGGLVAKSGDLTGFTIAGEDRTFYIAKAEIRGDKVAVWSPDVPRPVAVRMGWAGYPVVNLYNKKSLPASPFRTDDYPLTTQPH